MRIRWSSDLETGIRAIDLQHEELIGMLNELNTAYSEGCDQTILDEVMQQLAAYVIFHFGTEESLMGSLPHHKEHTNEHRRQHERFIAQIDELRTQAKETPQYTMGTLIDFLNEWLFGHILKSDRALGALLNQKKAQARSIATPADPQTR